MCFDIFVPRGRLFPLASLVLQFLNVSQLHFFSKKYTFSDQNWASSDGFFSAHNKFTEAFLL